MDSDVTKLEDWNDNQLGFNLISIVYDTHAHWGIVW